MKKATYTKFLTPSNTRNKTMEQARTLHPERWGKRIRIWKANEEIYLNPSNETKERLVQAKAA